MFSKIFDRRQPPAVNPDRGVITRQSEKDLSLSDAFVKDFDRRLQSQPPSSQQSSLQSPFLAASRSTSVAPTGDIRTQVTEKIGSYGSDGPTVGAGNYYVNSLASDGRSGNLSFKQHNGYRNVNCKLWFEAKNAAISADDVMNCLTIMAAYLDNNDSSKQLPTHPKFTIRIEGG